MYGYKGRTFFAFDVKIQRKTFALEPIYLTVHKTHLYCLTDERIVAQMC